MLLVTIAAGQQVAEARLESAEKSAPDAYPSSRTSAVSPDRRFQIISVDRDVEPRHTLFIEDLRTHLRRKLLDYGRQVEGLWSPDSKSIAVTDYIGSNVSQCLIFSTGMDAPPVDVWDEILRGIANEKERARLLKNDHVYIAGVRWTNSMTLKVRVWGHGDVSPAGFQRYYTFTLKPR